MEVVPGVWTTGEIERSTAFPPALPSTGGGRRIIIVDGEEAEDEILDDMALWMEVEGLGKIVITGCAHSGLVSTLLYVRRIGGKTRIYGGIGGTHLVGCSDEYLENTILGLRRLKLAMISPCHCTGFKGTSRLWRAFPDAFVLNYSSRVIETWEEMEDRVS
jgi:7,8-dihydropterin-6-yl-methyl-4-(beta-D-ribofuranosyl)aminobenzene 5'-phosphate synthase